MNIFTYSHRLGASAMATLALSALLFGLVPMQASAISLPTCTVEVVSNGDAFVQQKESNAQALSFVHPGWTASISGATWIWGDNPVAISESNETHTFQNQFGFVGNVTSATLQVASDNGHEASVNGGTSHSFGSSFNNVQSYDVTADIAQGDNELLIDVTNEGPVTDPAANPAGVLYKLTIQGTVTTDSDCSIEYGDPIPVLGCTDPEASNFNEAATSGNEQAENCSYVEPVCEIGENLLANGSFEDPVVTANGGQYEIFPSISDWLVSLSDGVELWRGIVAPSDGQQNVELDGNDATRITQTVTTVPGATYQLRFDFSARSENAADNHIEAAVDGVSLVNQSTDSSAWTTYTANFVADGSSDISFTDLGTAQAEGGTGTLLDNAVLCYVSDPVVVEEDTYRIEGFVYHDNNRNGEQDEEEGLAGRVVNITNNDGDNRSTETDANGFYFFEVPAGTWVITESLPDGWDLTTQESHVVTVPGVVEVSLIESIKSFLVPTAHAAVIGRPYGPFNFGNDEENRGGGGGGTRVGNRDNNDNDTPDGEVLGDSDSVTPTVLGDQVSAVPAGAPNAGAGGTAPRAIEFYSGAPMALLSRTKKHG